MRTAGLLVLIGLVLVGLQAGGAQASAPRGPSHQQVECTADGGSFSAGYGADPYVCVSQEGQVQTCDFGQSTPSCTSEDGGIRNRAAKHGQDQTGTSSPSMVRVMPVAPIL